jgi:hypothetical protein
MNVGGERFKVKPLKWGSETDWVTAIKELHEGAMKADIAIRRAQIADQLHQLLDKKRDEERGDMETTTLESGQTIDHHSLDKCASNPCAIHNPTKGPWDDWPRYYNEDNGLMYRMCPHNVLHPCVEDAIRIVKAITIVTEIIRVLLGHACCNQCVCLPRTGLPAEVFTGPAVVLPQHGAPLRLPAPQVQRTPDPNKYLKQWLWDRRLDIRPTELLMVLFNDIVDNHEITEIEVFPRRVRFSCSNECEGAFERYKFDGAWDYHKTSSGHYCPTMAMALMAGFDPIEDWNSGDEDGD